MPALNRDLWLCELHEPGRIGKGGGGIITQGHECATEAHAPSAGIRDTEVQWHDCLLRHDTGREQESGQK